MDDKTEQPVTNEPRCTAAGGHAEIINVPGYPLMVRAVDYNTLRAQLAEAQAALKTVMRNAELSKEPCDFDFESPAAIRNAKFASLASVAAQGLGMVSGPSLTAQLAEAQRDAELERALQQAAKDLPAHFVVRVINVERGAKWVQLYDSNGEIAEFAPEDLTLAEQVRAAIDAAMKQSND